MGKLNADIAYLKKKPGVCLCADIPDVFWPEAIRTAAPWSIGLHLEALVRKTPENLWHEEEKKRPEFHTLDCLVHGVIPKALSSDDWAPNSVRGAFLGPGVQRSGHRIVSHDSPLVFDTSQVTFVEDRLSLKKKNSTLILTSLGLITESLWVYYLAS